MAGLIILAIALSLAGLWRKELVNIISNTSKEARISKKNDKVSSAQKKSKNTINPARDYSKTKLNERIQPISESNKIIEKNEQNELEVEKGDEQEVEIEVENKEDEREEEKEMSVAQMKEEMTKELMGKISDLTAKVNSLESEKKKVKSLSKKPEKLRRGRKLVEKFKNLEQEMNQVQGSGNK